MEKQSAVIFHCCKKRSGLQSSPSFWQEKISEGLLQNLVGPQQSTESSEIVFIYLI